MDIRLLGPVEIHGSAGPVRLGGPKPRAVLATLALSTGRVVGVDRLIAAGWGDDPPASVVAQVHTTITRLRQALATARPAGPTAGQTARQAAAREGSPVIARRGDGYLLDVDRCAVDALAFEDLLADARGARDDPACAAGLLRRALGLWCGDPLDGAEPSGTVRAAAARLAEERLCAIEERIDVDLAIGRHCELTGELAELTARYPLREHLVALSMLALYRCGRQSDALRAYEVARTVLAEELGIDPGPDLSRRHRQILRRDPRLDPPAAPRRPRNTTP